MVSKFEPDRDADTGFSIADTPADLNDHLFRKMLEKSGAERLIIAPSLAAAWETPPANSSGQKFPNTSRSQKRKLAYA